jgi:uncharacterized protein
MNLSSPRAWYAAAAITVFVLTTQLNSLLKALGVTEMFEWPVVLSIRNALEVALCLAGIAIVHRFGLSRSVRELGLVAPIGRALVFAFIATLPMLVTFASTTVNPKMTVLGVVVFCFVAPFAEEVLFRGFMFRQFYRRARLGFWISALLPSALFAAAHLYQSRNLGETVGILAVTGLGGIGFCWVFMKWQDNLWAVFGLHALMNLWWEVFAVDDSALGGWLANGARLLTIALAILLTIHKDKIWKPLPIEAENVRLGDQAAA